MTNRFNHLKSKDWKRIGYLLTIIGCVQFIILSSLAMVFYPGGYSFLNDFLSYLGLTEVNGTKNIVSFWLWIIAANVAGLSLIPFWLIIRTLFLKSDTQKYVSTVGSLLGLVSGPFLMMIPIFTPDLNPDEHTIVTVIFFLLFAVAIAVYSVAILLNNDYPNHYAFVGIIFSIVIGMFIGGVFASIDVLMQKIIVYGFIVWVLFQVTMVSKAIKQQ